MKDKRWEEFIEWQAKKIREEEESKHEIELLRENEKHLQKILFSAIQYIERGDYTNNLNYMDDGVGDIFQGLLNILKGEDE